MLKYRQINQRKRPPRKLLLAPVRKLAHLILTKLPNQKSALVKRLVLVLVLNVVRMDERCEFDEWKFQKKKLQTCTRWSRWGHRKNDHVKYVSVYLRSVSSSLIIIPPHNKVVGGYTGFTISVCPSVRL